MDVLLDGKPMTREALVREVIARGAVPPDDDWPSSVLPRWMEFDVCEGMAASWARTIAEFCERRGIPVEVVQRRSSARRGSGRMRFSR